MYFASFYRHLGKPILDRLLSLIFLPIILPVCALVAIIIRASLGSPILYQQVRPGRFGKPFVLYKFRTMREHYDANGVLLDDNERLGMVGKCIRAISLDELPQFFNVLRGDMSLVGPRPLLLEYLPLYTEKQKRRHEVKPGITGWAQINGRNLVDWEKRFELDVWYVDHFNFWLDLRILAMTALKALRAEGITQDGHITMSKWNGRNNVS